MDLLGLETDGLLGLSPNFVSTSGDGELYLNSLKDGGAIGEAIFSMQLQFTSQDSKMWFGGYDEDLVKSYYDDAFKVNKTVDDMITWMYLTSEQYWQVPMREAKIGGRSMTLKSENAVFDSGSSLTYIPTKDYETFLNLVIPPGVNCAENA